MGDGQLHPAPGVVESTPDVLGMNIFDPLCHHPVLDLEVGYHGGAGALGDGHRVAHVVAVAVGDEDVVRMDVVGLHRRHRVARDKRVHQDLGLAAFEQKTGVTEPRGV